LGTTALQLAYVAKGSLAGTIVNRPKLWDIAAGVLLAEAAGAILSDWQGGKIFPIDLEKYQGKELPAVAANKKVHPQILKLLKSKTA
jgi:fructose-1,6-bisphosphatase/inositol monophosphatase family enzyme